MVVSYIKALSIIVKIYYSLFKLFCCFELVVLKLLKKLTLKVIE